MEDIKDLEGLEIFLWYACNVRCVFCYQKDLRFKYKNNLTQSEVETLLRDGFEQWKRFVIFAWGEPTLDKNLPHYISFAKSQWYKHIRIHTNWFRLKDTSYVSDLYERWLTGVIFSFHWYGKLHDDITQSPSSFANLDAAIRNVDDIISQDTTFVLDVNTVLYKWNYRELLKLFLYLGKFKITRCQLNYCSSLELFTNSEKKDLMVEYKDSLPYIKKILYISKKIKLKVVIDNIPYCVIEETYYPFIKDNIKNDRVSHLVTWEKRDDYAATYDSVQTETCKDCIFSGKCMWIPRDYYELFWDSCLKTLHV